MGLIANVYADIGVSVGKSLSDLSAVLLWITRFGHVVCLNRVSCFGVECLQETLNFTMPVVLSRKLLYLCAW